jgi:hypothetical protein
MKMRVRLLTFGVGLLFLGCGSEMSGDAGPLDGGSRPSDGGPEPVDGGPGPVDGSSEDSGSPDAGNPCLTHTCYFVDAENGDDANTGATEATAWRTLSKISDTAFEPGDFILLRRGDTWRETLTVTSSGTEENPITYGAWGSGALPRILGSSQSTDWTNMGGNIWMSATTVADPTGGAPHDGQSMGAGGWPGGAYFVEDDGTATWGHQQKYMPLTNLTQEYDWVWDGGHVYVYSPTDPGTRYDAVEVCQRQDGIALNDREHLVFEDIELQFQCATGIGESYPTADLTGLTIRRCRVSHLGIKNGAAQGLNVTHSNMLIEDNVIHDIGRRGISINAYGTDFTIHDVVIEGNTLYNGFHTTGVDMSTGTATSFDAIVIRGNLVYDDPTRDLRAPEDFVSESIFLQNYGSDGATFTNVRVHNNVIRNTTKDAIQLENVQSSFVYNNTFYGVNQVRTNNTIFVVYSNGSTNAVLKNNIFYGNGDYDHNTTAVSVYLGGGVDPSDVDADYNLYFQDDTRMPIVVTQSDSFRMGDWASLRSDIGWEPNSPTPQDPSFVMTGTDEHLRAGSPAINAGTDMGLPFEGAAPDIGAFEHAEP